MAKTVKAAAKAEKTKSKVELKPVPKVNSECAVIDLDTQRAKREQAQGVIDGIDRFVPLKQVALAMGCCVETVRQRSLAGRLPPLRRAGRLRGLLLSEVTAALNATAVA